jgi:hypothetical protein
MGRLANNPRIEGMMQKLHLLLQPSEIYERIVLRRQMLVHRAHHFFIGVRAGHLEHLGMTLEDALGPGAEASGDDDLAVLLQRLADGVE